MALPRRLFTPGTGAVPPLLAGREREQAVLTECLADLVGGSAPPHDVALIGPRGAGKTVLLHWFAGRCREARRVSVAALFPSQLRTEQALVDSLLPVGGLRKLLMPRRLGVTGAREAEREGVTRAATNLVGRLIARCRRKPLVVLLDEAHTLEVGVGQLLLSASQGVRAAAPFLLVLAGTPGLPAHLGAMHASFWSRLGPGRLGLDLLSAEASRAALAEPLLTHGVAIGDAALDLAVAESQCYPYFIQLWGQALWARQLATRAPRLGTADLEAVRPAVEAWVTDHYEDRYRELDRSGRLAAAERVAARYRSRNTLTHEEPMSAIVAGLGAEAAPDRTHEALDALERLGFVWRPPGQPPPVRYEAGIPSLMTFVLEHEPPRRPPSGAAGGGTGPG